MPIMNGYEACKEIKKIYSEKENSNLTILALTADATKEN